MKECEKLYPCHSLVAAQLTQFVSSSRKRTTGGGGGGRTKDNLQWAF